jgi:hypothetical protein
MTAKGKLTEYLAFSHVKAVLQDLYKMEPAGAE